MAVNPPGISRVSSADTLGAIAPRILVVEDDLDTATLMRETLEDHFGAGCVTVCPSLTDAIPFELADVDIVLSDMNLPDGTGLDLLSNFLQRRGDLPVVLITGEGILENALAAIRHGAYDYIVKAGDYLWALPLIVEKNLALWRTKRDNLRLQDELKRTVEEVRIKNDQLQQAVNMLESMASTDPLTGLDNRRAFGESLRRCFAEATRYGHDLACLMIDLDNFKTLNDTLGHPSGDELLERAARILKANCRGSDICARFGGDEFIVLLPQTDETTARHVARRIRDQFLGLIRSLFGGTAVAGELTMSMGLASLRTSRPANPDQLVAQADHALYAAKQAGRNRMMLFHPNATAGKRSPNAA